MKTSTVFVGALGLAMALSAKGPKPPEKKAPQVSTEAVKRKAVDGDQAYKANCSRGHLPPRKFTPGKMATIRLHMRARANMTAAETEAILRYLTE